MNKTHIFFICLDSPNLEWFTNEYHDMSYSNFQSLLLWPDTHLLTIL